MDLIGYNKRVQKDKVTGFEKFAYGCGEISTNIVFTIATSLLTMFYTDVAHVSAATIGMIIAISQIFNGASDICAGFIVDRTRSKYGRARVWMLRMSGPFGNILVTLLFTRILKMMPNGGMDSQKNWVILTAIYAIGAALMMLFCFVNVRERVVVKDEAAGDKVPLKKALPALFKNKYFILLFLFFVSFAMYQTFQGTMATYYCKWIIGDTDIIGNVNTACYGITIVATLLLGKVMHLTSKRNWCIIGALFIIAGSLLLILNPTSVALVTFGGLLRGIGMTPILGMIFTMIADSIEYGQWKTGLRTAGAIQSATTSGQKFGQGIGSALIGFIMQGNGYNGDMAVQSAHTLQTISNLFIYGIAILGAIMIVILLFYHLDKEYPKIIRELLERESKVVLKD